MSSLGLLAFPGPGDDEYHGGAAGGTGECSGMGGSRTRLPSTMDGRQGVPLDPQVTFIEDPLLDFNAQSQGAGSRLPGGRSGDGHGGHSTRGKASRGGQALSPPKPSIRKSASATLPGPGHYKMVSNDAYSKRKPVYSFTSPDRKNLDLMLGTWTLASSSLQPRAPDPEHPGNAGKNGVYMSPSWSFDKGAGPRTCLEKEKPRKTEVELHLPNSVGTYQPMSTKRSGQSWSLTTKDRTHLPAKDRTWTPAVSSDWRPGPGDHRPENVTGTGYQGRFKACTRRSSTWGTRNGMAHGPKQWTWVPPMPDKNVRPLRFVQRQPPSEGDADIPRTPSPRKMPEMEES